MITKITSGCRRSWTSPRHHKVFSDQLLCWSSAVLDRCKADKSGSESINSSISHILTARDVSKSFQACKNTMVCQSDVSCWICAVLILGFESLTVFISIMLVQGVLLVSAGQDAGPWKSPAVILNKLTLAITHQIVFIHNQTSSSSPSHYLSFSSVSYWS